MNKKIATAGLVAGLLAGGGAGLALAMSGDSDVAPVAAASAAVENLDADMGVTGMPADRAGLLEDALQPLLDDGTLTQEQYDKVIAALQAAGPMGGDMHGGRGGHGPGRGGLYGIDGSPFAIVADTLGLTEDEVVAAVEGGQTIADLATANGSSADAVIAALVAEVEAHLAAEVEAGDHTQEEADARLADATTAITSFVNDTTAFPVGGDMHDDLDGDDNA